MTIKKATELFDSEYRNTVSDSLKVFWLSQLDMKIYCELLKSRGLSEFSGYDETTPKSRSLLAPEEFAEIYIAYLTMQTDKVNGEIRRFNNSAEIYNRLYYEMASFISREKPVKESAKIKAASDYV